jgi:hypothetical protein
MRNIRSRNTVKEWARLVARLGLLLTEPGVRATLGDQVKDRVDNMTDTIANKYEDAVERLEAAGAALQGRVTYRPSRVLGFLLGVGAGAGLGILLAPGAGNETREAIRAKAIDVKNKVVESATMATGRIRQSVTSISRTGTQG